MLAPVAPLARTASGGGQRESSWDAPAPVGHPRFVPDPTELAERPHCLGTWGRGAWGWSLAEPWDGVPAAAQAPCLES